MLQIDHIYEFLYNNIFKDLFNFYYPNQGVIKSNEVTVKDITVFTQGWTTTKKIFFYDQEPLLEGISENYLDIFNFPTRQHSIEEVRKMNATFTLPYGLNHDIPEERFNNVDCFYKDSKTLVTSERSQLVDTLANKYNFYSLYYFFHGFAALDWYRGHYSLNYNKPIVKQYNYDFISFNRIINNDRSYRIYFVSLLKEQGLLDKGLVSFNVTDNLFDDWQDEIADTNSKLSANAKHHIEHHLTDISKLIIDCPELPGSASSDIPRGNDAFWHVVTETVFYYNKLHLTEKIFKPIVSKQPFILLAAPGNLAYLKSYGFKTFDSVIDESYDLIQDNDLRTQAVVDQLYWYCNLTPDEKTDIIQQLQPIIDYNFHHFYGEFKHIITRELIDNTKTLFKEIDYDDRHIDYNSIHHVLTH